MADIHNQENATESENQEKKPNFPRQRKNHSEFISVMVIYALVTGIITVLLNKIITLPISIIFFVYIVVFATFMTMVLRKFLYQHLQDSQTQKNIFRKILPDFKKASQSLEIVNTNAMIDEFYVDEEFDFFEFNLLCEKWDYFSRILPNLLISFGLLGTFWGITYNLSSIAEVLNSSQSTDTISLDNLQVPLKSMGIAFTSSLVALSCSILMTFANFVWNTRLAKNRLFSKIENQLDNVTMRKAKGETRLSKIVKEVVEQQKEFLTNFHQEVLSPIQSSFTEFTNKIIEQNQINSDSVTGLCENFK